MTPTLRQLEYVVAVADAGQFVEAARRCSVSQPALSKQVREVEDMLGVELFERTRPRVLVTLAGEEVVRRARSILRDARELVDAARAHTANQQGTLRLGVIPTIAPYGLPGFLTRLRDLFPAVGVAIEELQTEVLLESLRRGDIDLGLLARPFDTHSLTGADIVTEPFVMVAPQGHPLSTPGSLELRDIAGASLILMQDGHCLRDQAMEICDLAGDPPSTSVTAASVATLVRMVESGLGATLLPTSAVRAEVREGSGMVVRSFAGSMPGRRITLAWRSSSPQEQWYREIAAVLTQHYLGLNEEVPDHLSGPRPRITAAP